MKTSVHIAKGLFISMIILLSEMPESAAQVTYTASNYTAPGDSFMVSLSPEAAIPLYDFDTAGPNLIWIFDTLQAVTQHYRKEETPSSTGYKNAFLYNIPLIIPGCIEQCTDSGGVLLSCTSGCNTQWNQLTHAELTWDTINLQTIKFYDLYNFYAKTSTTFEKRLIAYKVDLVGVPTPLTTNLATPDVVYKFPIVYGNKDSSISSYVIDLGLPFVYSHWQQRVNNVDAWGALTTPYGTFPNTVRVKSTVQNIDKFIFDTGDTLDLSTILPDSIIEYKWFDPAWGIPVMTATSFVQAGIEVFVKAEYIDSVRCLNPIPLFGYLPVPTYLDITTDSVNVKFYNLAANSDSLHWNFGDSASGTANTSNEYTPNHWYTNPGAYLVELIGCNTSPQCGSTICDTVKLPVIVVDTTAVYANFNVKPFYPCGGDTVFFINTSANDTAWFWDFGDGGTSTIENPNHIYLTGGTFNVKLIAYNGFQSDTIIKPVTVKNTPVVSFTYSDSLTNLAIQFTSTSTGVDTSTSYLWTFAGGSPDKNYSSVINPAVTFNLPGQATVCLLALNSLGCSKSFCKQINVSECLTAKFKTSGISNSFCVNTNITLTNQTTTGLALPISYKWLSDGVQFATATDTSTSYSTLGQHTISLVASNSKCADTTDRVISVKGTADLFSAGNDTTIFSGDSVKLSPSYTTGGQSGVTYNWSPGTGLSATNIPQPWAKPSVTTSYIFTLGVVGGACDLLFSEKDTIKITVVPVSTPYSGTFSIQDISIIPNPGHGNPVLTYSVAEKSEVVIEVYTVLGEKIYTGFNEILEPGIHSHQLFTGNSKPATGIYFVKLINNNMDRTVKLITD